MDNIHADHELDAKTLRRAVNADVLDSGKIRRRKGFSPFLAEPGAHSLWASSLGAAFFVSGQTLWRLFADGTKQPIGTPAGSTQREFSDQGATLALRNPETGALTGQTITHGELYAILWSLAMESAALADTQPAQEPQ